MIELDYKEPERLARMEAKMKALAKRHGLDFGWESTDFGSGYCFYTKRFWLFDENVIEVTGRLTRRSRVKVLKRGYEKLSGEVAQILSEQ